jgi:cell division protein FtsZ
MSKLPNLKPRIVVVGVGGAGGNAVNNMIAAGLTGVQFIAANTDLQALASSRAEHRIQLGSGLTEGLGAGSKPDIGEAAAEEALEEISAHLRNAHMVFIAAGMGGGTGTGAAYVVARVARELGILTIAVVTKPFQFEGATRMRNAEAGIAALAKYVDTLLVIPNENLFRVATDRTTFAEAFVVADQVLYSGIACLVDLIVEEGLINLDLADVRAVLGGMGAAMMGTGEASGEQRATIAAEEAIVNPLLDDVSLKGAKSLLLSIRGGRDLTLWEVDEAANRVRQEVDHDANIIVGATLDESLEDRIRVSIVASGMPASNVVPEAEADAPAWEPRFLDDMSASDQFVRRLAEAISERDPKGKGRAGQKGRGKGKRLPGEPPGRGDALPNVQPHPHQPQIVRPRRSPVIPRALAQDEVRLQAAPDPTQASGERPMQLNAPSADAAGSVGWPEHWARADEAADRARDPGPTVVPLRQPAPPLRQIGPPALHVEPTDVRREPPVRQEDPQAKRNSLLQRLAGLVGSRRQA